MFHCANCWFERWRGRSLSDSQHSHTATSSSCGNKCAHRRRSIADQREVQQGTVAQVTQGTTLRLYHSITREHIDRVSGS